MAVLNGEERDNSNCQKGENQFTHANPLSSIAVYVALNIVVSRHLENTAATLEAISEGSVLISFRGKNDF